MNSKLDLEGTFPLLQKQREQQLVRQSKPPQAMYERDSGSIRAWRTPVRIIDQIYLQNCSWIFLTS